MAKIARIGVPARRSQHHHPVAKTNPALPLWPLGVLALGTAVSIPLTATLLTGPMFIATGMYGSAYVSSQVAWFALRSSSDAVKSLGLYIHPVPILAAGASFLASRQLTPDTSLRVLGTVIGYGVGVVAYQPYFKKTSDEATAAWCKEHSSLAPNMPSCSSPEVLALHPQSEQDKKWCEDTPVLPWLSPSCYGIKGK